MSKRHDQEHRIAVVRRGFKIAQAASYFIPGRRARFARRQLRNTARLLRTLERDR